MVRRDLTRGLTFDDAPDRYDRYRPRYPHQLFDDVAEMGAIDGASRILEVGCGPGLASEELIARGWSVLAVEPGTQLARVAREKLCDDRFAVEVSTFEEWQPRGRRFDLVFSASAYHWVAPELRWVKAAEVLAHDGHIALAGHHALREGSFHDFTEATRGLRAAHGVDDERESPGLEDVRAMTRDVANDIGEFWEAMSPQGTSEVAGGLFATPEVRVYPWSTTYSTPEALGLMGTYSRYLAMEPGSRAALFERLGTVIDDDFAGVLTRSYATVLAMARRR